jgi:hypothetical protein
MYIEEINKGSLDPNISGMKDCRRDQSCLALSSLAMHLKVG